MSAEPRVTDARTAPLHAGTWRASSSVPALGVAEVHVWKARVSDHVARALALHETLDADERSRAARFHAAIDRTRYVIAHGLLREILGGYLGVHAHAIGFRSGAYGKPAIASPSGSPLQFNMSHAGDIVLVAVASDQAVGVDVEAWITDMEHREIAEQFFSPSERGALRRLSGDALCVGFFACWTRKEAYIKATGLGVSAGLDYFDVSLAPGERAALLDDRLHARAVTHWTVRDLSVGDGYSGALVCASTTASVECYALEAPGTYNSEQNRQP